VNDVPYRFEGNIVCTRPGVPLKNVSGKVHSNRNLFWQDQDPEQLRQWLQAENAVGREVDSMVADPHFVDAENYDFRIGDLSPAISDLGFNPFDPGQAGLTGDAEWTSLPGKIQRAHMEFWKERARKLSAHNETDRRRAGFTP